MRKLLSTTALSVSLTLGAVSLATTSLQANPVAQTKQQSGTVINLAGKQRMLTQKMSKEALFIAKGVSVDANKASLAKTITLFDKTLKGLVAGDESLGLPATTNADILAQLKVVTDLWTPFKDAVEKGDLAAINKQNIPLLKNMNKAVGMYTKASGSTLDPKMAKVINLAGKQRMLSQKMTKELLLVANGIDADVNGANAKKTVALFGSTLKELDAGCKNDGIKAQFAVVAKTLAEYQPIVEKLDISDEALAKAEKLNIPLLKESNKAVQMLNASIK